MKGLLIICSVVVLTAAGACSPSQTDNPPAPPSDTSRSNRRRDAGDSTAQCPDRPSRTDLRVPITAPMIAFPENGTVCGVGKRLQIDRRK